MPSLDEMLTRTINLSDEALRELQQAERNRVAEYQREMHESVMQTVTVNYSNADLTEPTPDPTSKIDAIKYFTDTGMNNCRHLIMVKANDRLYILWRDNIVFTVESQVMKVRESNGVEIKRLLQGVAEREGLRFEEVPLFRRIGERREFIRCWNWKNVEEVDDEDLFVADVREVPQNASGSGVEDYLRDLMLEDVPF